MKKIFKYIFRIFLGLILTLIVIIILAAVIIRTDYFKKKLPPIIEKQASAFLNGKLTVGSVDGNFFTGLILRDILLTSDSDTIAFISEINAQYNLLPLLRGKLEISSVKLDHPYVFLQQINDSTWNLQQIIKSKDTIPEDTISTSNPIEIDLSKVLIVEGHIKIESADTLIPRQIDHFNTKFSINYSEKKQKIILQEFSLQTKSPDLDLKKLSFELTRNQDIIELKDLYLKTAQNQLVGKGKYHTKEEMDASADLQTHPLQLNEFEYFLKGIKIPVTPAFKLDASIKNDSLIATIDMQDHNESIHLNLALANFPDLIYNQVDSLIRYKLNAKLVNVNLKRWSGLPDMNYIINGNLAAEGKGISPETAVVDLNGDLKDLTIKDKTIQNVDFVFHLNRGNLKGKLEGHGQFGEFSVKPEITGVMSKRPAYVVDLVTRRLDLAQLTGVDSLKSDINMQARLQGRGYDPKTMVANAKVFISGSQIFDIKVDTMLANIRYSSENVLLDSLLLQTRTLNLNAKGNYSKRSNSDLVLSATLKSLDELKYFIPVKGILTSGKIDAHLSGRPDSLNLESVMAFNQTVYDSVFMDSIFVKANANLTKFDTTVNAHLLVKNIRNKSFQVDSVVMDVDATPDFAYVKGKLMNRDINTSLKAELSWGEKIRIRLDDLLLGYKDQNWALQQPPAIIEIDSVNYRITDFKLASNNTDSAQYISANGIFSMKGEEDFKLKLANIDIRQMAQLFGQNLDASGNLNLDMHLKGLASSPRLTGTFGIDEAVFNKYKIAEFDGNIDYRNNILKLESKIVPQDSGRIEVSGVLPLHVRLDSASFKFNKNDSIFAHLTVDHFPMAVFQTLNLTEEIKGFIDGEVTVKGTVKSPDAKGSLQLVDASLRIPQYGVKYDDIAFKVEFVNDKIMLDTFAIKTSDGKMVAAGQIDFNSDFYKGDISNSTIKVNFDKFNMFDHKQFNVQLTGDATLGGEKDKVVFGGNVTIPKAEVYLPYIFNMMGKFHTPPLPKPILVREMNKLNHTEDTLILISNETIAQDSNRFDYFDGLTGKLKLEIPKNTWIKNENMHIELSGDLELIKNHKFFELFGTVDVVRGQYDLFGRTFKIDEGTLSFNGGEEISPEMNIRASYKFRNSLKIQQQLTVNITGTVSSPTISFLLDGNAINDGDALSYILFGKGLNELSIDQNNDVSESASAGSIAGNAAASILSSQLTKFLGNKLDFDYLELKTSGGFDHASLVVGKYITNDLFVSYEQQFGQTDQKDIAKYEVKLEYELFKFLFLQLNNSSNDSGFDVVFKLEAK